MPNLCSSSVSLIYEFIFDNLQVFKTKQEIPTETDQKSQQ